jgi:hypothetical protein
MVEEVELEREVVRVYEWRLQLLKKAGFTFHNAALIASSELDWHDAVRIRDNAMAKGHDEELVMQILF